VIEGIRCPPACHKYKPHGKVLVCTACADVQPLLLADDTPAPQRSTGNAPPTAPEPYYEQPPEPTAADMEAHIARLRQAAGLAEAEAEQQSLFGQRQPFTGDLSDLEMMQRSNGLEWPRVPVNEGYNIHDLRDDRLPDPGL
jgi:hypothetical protein